MFWKTLPGSRIPVRRSSRAVLSLVSVIAVFVVPTTVPGQTRADYRLSTDRPDLSEASTVVPAGLLQLEIGVHTTRGRGAAGPTVSNTPTLFRIGAGGGWEIRLGGDGLVVIDVPGAQSVSGLADLVVGFKRSLGKDLALLGSVALPTAAAPFSNGSAVYGFIVAWDSNLGGGWELGFNYGGSLVPSFPGADTRHYEHFVSAAFGHDLTTSLGVFFDLYGLRSHRRGSRTLLSTQVGATYLLTRLLQVDLYADLGLTRRAPARSLGAGLSVVF